MLVMRTIKQQLNLYTGHGIAKQQLKSLLVMRKIKQQLNLYAGHGDS
jgi:hypothetical protein